MQLWRVSHHETDHGPFGSLSFNDAAYAHEDYIQRPNALPTPWEEGLLQRKECAPYGDCPWRSACTTLTQLREWLGLPWVVESLTGEYEIRLLRAPTDAVRLGKHQALVRIDRAKLVGAWPISNLLLPRKSWKEVRHA
jgi:hypothetical protein